MTTQELVERLVAQELVERLGAQAKYEEAGEYHRAASCLRAAASRLVEMEAAIKKIEAHLSNYIEMHTTVDVSVAVAFETARAALEHQP